MAKDRLISYASRIVPENKLLEEKNLVSGK